MVEQCFRAVCHKTDHHNDSDLFDPIIFLNDRPQDDNLSTCMYLSVRYPGWSPPQYLSLVFGYVIIELVLSLHAPVTESEHEK